MTSAIHNQLTIMQNATARMEAEKRALEGPQQELGQDTFLKLMLEQLKQQDPLNPIDNKEFLSQQAQFTQLNELQKMNQNMARNTQISQASSLIGKDIVLLDPNDSSRFIEGKVTAANFSDTLATVVVNGKEYPLGYVMQVKDSGSTVPPPEVPSTPDPDETLEG